MNDHFLNTRVPPLALVSIAALIMWFTKLALPPLWFPQHFDAVADVVKFAAIALGLLTALLGVIQFRRAQTTVDPRSPEKSASLVTGGIYRFSRNPMYVGFVLWLLALSLQLEQLWSLALIPIFAGYMNRFQIKPEEQMLAAHFGNDYLDYCERVPRWLGLSNGAV